MKLYYEELYRYGIKFTLDAAETKDSVNQFFLYFWEQRNKLQPVENPKAYIFTSYKHWLLAWLRQQKQRKTFPLPEDTAQQLSEPSYEHYLIEQVQDEELAEALRQAIATLPARQRQLLQLRFYEHLSHEEIAEKTSLSIRTVYNKLHEAVKKLRTNSLITCLKTRFL